MAVTVTGRYTTATGAPCSGAVQFLPSVPALSAPESARIIEVAPVTVQLDGTGAISVQLLATDDPDTQPAGWSYTVAERITGADERRWVLTVPVASPTLDLSTVAPAVPGPTVTTYALAATVAAHTAATTAVHGIPDTSVLETVTGSAAKVSAHVAAADPHGDRAFATSVVATHTAAEDPHRDRSYAAGLVAGLGTAAERNVGTTTGTVAAGDDSRIVAALQTGNNLSDVASPTAARTNLGSKAPDVQTFTISGTWAKPSGAVWVAVTMIGAGQGGGSGRRGATLTVRCGGGGGCGGATGRWECPASSLPATVAITIGAGGVGGSAITTDDTNGAAGSVPGSTVFGSYLSSYGGGSAGQGGTAATGTGGSGTGSGAGPFGTGGGAGGNASTIGGTGIAGGWACASGGGAGGGVNTSDASGAGGSGGSNTGFQPWIGSGGTGGTAGGGNGGNGTNGVAGTCMTASGGGGGGSGVAVNGGTGGSGGFPGGGGGGGGAAINGKNSGAGGTGGSGLVQVITYF